MREPFRVTPALPAQYMKTYAISSPLATHWRDGTCDEAGCLAYRKGWLSNIDESTEFGQRQAFYIRKVAGRRFTETRTAMGLTSFEFPAGQRCFTTHKVPLERPEIYVVRGGDWRGDPRGERARVFSGPDAWVNSFGEHQDRIARVVNG